MGSAAQVIFGSLEQYDKSATLFLNSLHCPLSDSVWVFFSNKYVWFVLYAIVLYYLFRRLGWKRALLATGILVLTIVCCDQFANLVKNSACRFRPTHDEWMVSHGLNILCGLGGNYGFFSAHAANAFGFATASWGIFSCATGRNYRTYGIAIHIWAAMVALSRVFVGRHFLGDVLVGTLVGVCFGLIAAYLFRRLSQLIRA